MTLEELIEQRDHLLEARAGGLRAVQFADGRRVEYRSDRDMLAVLSDLERRIAEMQSRPAPKTILFATSKGF